MTEIGLSVTHVTKSDRKAINPPATNNMDLTIPCRRIPQEGYFMFAVILKN